MAALTYGVTTVGLPDELLWTDEYAWQPVQQRTEYSVTGALLIESAVKLAGQPMTDRRQQTLAQGRTRPGAAYLAPHHRVSINSAAPITGVSTINNEQAEVFAALKLKKPTNDLQISLL